jgi:hypothetical protein
MSSTYLARLAACRCGSALTAAGRQATALSSMPGTLASVLGSLLRRLNAMHRRCHTTDIWTQSREEAPWEQLQATKHHCAAARLVLPSSPCPCAWLACQTRRCRCCWLLLPSSWPSSWLLLLTGRSHFRYPLIYTLNLVLTPRRAQMQNHRLERSSCAALACVQTDHCWEYLQVEPHGATCASASRHARFMTSGLGSCDAKSDDKTYI